MQEIVDIHVCRVQDGENHDCTIHVVWQGEILHILYLKLLIEQLRYHVHICVCMYICTCISTSSLFLWLFRLWLVTFKFTINVWCRGGFVGPHARLIRMCMARNIRDAHQLVYFRLRVTRNLYFLLKELCICIRDQY